MKTAIRVVALLITASLAWPAAASPRPLVCQAAGSLQGPDAYLDAAGTCTGGLTGPYTVAIYAPYGVGGIDPCITLSSPVAIPVTVTLTNTQTGQVTTQVQEWFLLEAPPGEENPAIVFTINTPSGPVQKTRGAGVIVTRVFGVLSCNDLGPRDRPSASFAWAIVG